MDGVFGALSSTLTSLAGSIAGVCVALAVVAGVVCVIGYLMAKSEQKAEMFKSWGIRICIGLLVLALIPLIISTVQGMTGRWYTNPDAVESIIDAASKTGG